jgi:hypothetical protein
MRRRASVKLPDFFHALEPNKNMREEPLSVHKRQLWERNPGSVTGPLGLASALDRPRILLTMPVNRKRRSNSPPGALTDTRMGFIPGCDRFGLTSFFHSHSLSREGLPYGSVPVGVQVSRCCHLPRDLVGLEKERSHRNTVCRHNAGTISFLVSWCLG